ncbi:hypothetical protein GCM10023339_10040 [Alloalcanivorax gelatiniphagus]
MRLSPGAQIVLLLVWMCASCATASDPAGAPRPAGEKNRTTVGGPPRAERATSQETVTYDEAGHEMDIYVPASATPGAPPVLIVHGVSHDSSPKDFSGFAEWGARLSAAGHVVAVPNFDAVPGGSRAGVAQLREAVRFLRRHVGGRDAGSLGLVMMGFSAGGPDWVEASFDPANQPVNALVGYYAEIEPPRPSDGSESRSLAGQLASNDKPALLAYGLEDTAPRILSSLRTFRRRASPAGHPTTILTHTGARHGFDFLEHDSRTRAIISRTMDFISSAPGPGERP